MEETLLRALVQFLVFMDDYEGLEFDGQDTLHQYETLAELLTSMPQSDRAALHARFSALLDRLDDQERALASDFLDGLDLLDGS